jgi:hypothetical protein
MAIRSPTLNEFSWVAAMVVPSSTPCWRCLYPIKGLWRRWENVWKPGQCEIPMPAIAGIFSSRGRSSLFDGKPFIAVEDRITIFQRKYRLFDFEIFTHRLRIDSSETEIYFNFFGGKR